MSLMFVFGEDGIIARAEQAKLESEVARVREELEMAEAMANIDGKGHIDMDHYWEILEDEEIIGDRNTDVSNDDGDGTYEIRATVETNQRTATKTIGTTLGEIPTGKVEFTTPVWGTGNKASVIISTEETGYTLQYQINGYENGKWEDATSGETIGNLSYGDTVYGRLTDGKNESDHASVTVEDKTVPQAANIELSATSTAPGGTITATVTLTDNESGVDAAGSKWVYNIQQLEI